MSPAIVLSVPCFSWGHLHSPTPLFQNLHVSSPLGGWTALMGPSGCGKSTLLRLVAGLIPSAPNRDFAVSHLPQGVGAIGWMGQTDGLFPWCDALGNALANRRLLGLPCGAAEKDEALDMLSRAGLQGLEKRQPHQLSGGQRQRLALVRTLMGRPQLLLLDEPFSALDTYTRAQLQDLAWEMLKGKTVLMVTHDPAEAARLAGTIHLFLNSAPPTTLLTHTSDTGSGSQRDLPPWDSLPLLPAFQWLMSHMTPSGGRP